MTDLRELLASLSPYVLVCGSWARGEQREDSDIDLAPRCSIADLLPVLRLHGASLIGYPDAIFYAIRGPTEFRTFNGVHIDLSVVYGNDSQGIFPVKVHGVQMQAARNLQGYLYTDTGWQKTARPGEMFSRKPIL